jgi:hypothetical protein
MKKSVVRASGPKPFQTGKTFEEDSIHVSLVLLVFTTAARFFAFEEFRLGAGFQGSILTKPDDLWKHPGVVSLASLKTVDRIAPR